MRFWLLCSISPRLLAKDRNFSFQIHQLSKVGRKAITKRQNFVIENISPNRNFTLTMPNTYVMELKPEHLQKFPFYEDLKAPGLLVQLGENIVFPASRNNLSYIIENQLKPLLRPLSELKKKLNDKVPVKIQQELTEVFKAKNTGLLKPATKAMLAKHLFDIDGLIEAGLALPYHFELKKDPESFWAFD